MDNLINSKSIYKNAPSLLTSQSGSPPKYGGTCLAQVDCQLPELQLDLGGRELYN